MTNALFKYMRAQHADRLVKEGVLRIGTLSEYRRTEEYGQEVGDQEEGHQAHFERIDNLTVGKGGGLSQFAKGIISAGHGVRLENVTVMRTNDSPELFIYSTSAVFDAEAMEGLGYDACVRIDYPRRFFEIVSDGLRNVGEFLGFQPCVYAPRNLPPGEPHAAHPALLKDPRYSHQQEVRALWRPLAPNPKPSVIICRRARAVCVRQV